MTAIEVQRRKVSLEDICTRVSSGGTPSRKRPENYSSEGHLWVKSKELNDARIGSTEECISDEGLGSSSAKYFKKDTVLIAMYGATVGKLGVLEVPATTNQAICGLEVNEEIADFRYVFYALLHTREALTEQAFGAAQQNLNQGLIREFELDLPPLHTQRKIAGILSAYEDLIENNTRRIAILEEMARRIYEEWFVHFRYPGHENVPLVESELGPIPEGWEVKRLGEVADISPRTHVPKEGFKPFVPMASLSESSLLISDIVNREGNSGSKFMNGDTLLARITPCLENGKTGYVQFLSSPTDVAFGSTEFIVMRSIELCPDFVYLLARSSSFRSHAIKSMSGATGRQRVREAAVADFRIAVPPQPLLLAFKSVASALFSQAHVLGDDNRTLAQCRDLLLPKLVGGLVIPTFDSQIALRPPEEIQW